MTAPKGAKPGGAAGTALVGLALYEAVAQDLVEATGLRILPSFAHFVETHRWRQLTGKLFPSWGPTVGFAATGLAISTIRAARRKQRAT